MKAHIYATLMISIMVGCTDLTTIDNYDQIKKIDTDFYTSFESSDTKVYWENANDSIIKFNWSTNDSLSIFCSTSFNHKYVFNGESSRYGTFSRIEPSSFYTDFEIPTNYAIYPYNSTNYYMGDGKIQTELPQNQYTNYGNGWNNLMVAVTQTPEDHHLVFKNVCGFLFVELQGNCLMDVQSAFLKGNNSEVICGPCTVTATADGEPTVTTSSLFDNWDKICISDGWLDYNSDNVIVWQLLFALPPMTFTKGFTLTVVNTKGQVFEKSVTESKTIERNIVNRMEPLEVTFSGPSTFIHFDDPNLESHIASQYDIDRDGKISTIEADGITYLDFSNGFRPKSYAGLEQLPNLQYLLDCDIDGDVLDLTGLQSLEYISINQNADLKSVNCSGLINLTEFTYYGPYDPNQKAIGGYVEKIDLSNCTALKYVICERSLSLSELILKGCSSLKWLFASWCNISSIDLSELPKLERVELTGNPLSSINFSNNPDLKKVFIQSSNIDELDISNNPKLETLYADNDNIKGNGESLTVLTIQYASSSCTVPFPNLKTLNIWSKEGVDVEKFDLSACSKLENFTTSWRKIKHIVFGASANTLKRITIEHIEGLEDVIDFSKFPSLEKLDCRGGTFSLLDVSPLSSTLNTLYCEDSPNLTEIWLKTGQTIADFTHDPTTTVKYKD